MSMYQMGLNEDEYPILFQCGRIEVKICEINTKQAYIAPYVKGRSESGCFVVYEDMPYKALRDLHKVIKKYLK